MQVWRLGHLTRTQGCGLCAIPDSLRPHLSVGSERADAHTVEIAGSIRRLAEEVNEPLDLHAHPADPGLT
jgi:hypothetical protein